MTFDARAIKLLQPGQHLTSDEFPGLRMEASQKYRTWCYRYKSPTDGRMRQIKIGRWPAMSFHAAVVQWEALKAARDGGEDVADTAKEEKVAKRLSVRQEDAPYTVGELCSDYHAGHVLLSRQKKGADEVGRMFATMLGDFRDLPAAEVTRSQAFSLIHGFADSAPVQAKNLKGELGAAWDYAIDSGRLPDSSPNWWRIILRGKIKSKGKKLAGERVGGVKRVLSAQEIGLLIPWLPNFTALVEDALTMYLWTGVRGDEVVGVEGREVQREGDGILWWVIPKAKTKNARHEGATDHRVPLFGRAEAVVLRRKERYGDGLLYPTRKRNGSIGPADQKAIGVAVWMAQPYSATRPEYVRPRLPVTRWAPHDLRRSVRTLLASMGCPHDVGEVILGHMLPGVGGVYNQYRYDAEKVEWLRKLSDRLEELARPA